MRRSRIAAALCALAGCGGGGGSDPVTPRPEIAAGRYGVTFSALSEFGELVTDRDARIVYNSRPFMAYGDWSYAGSNAAATLSMLAHPIDDLNNEFPSAKAASQTRTLNLAPGSSASTWAGGGVVIDLNNRDAPALASIPRNWRFRNLYRFGTVFMDYTLQLDVDTAGVISGFDTNGCQFSGALQPPIGGERFYSVTISTRLCGATNQYIENAQYEGFAYLEAGPGVGQQSLVISAVARPMQLGIAVRVTAPQ